MLASRRPRHPVGWLLLVMGLTMAVSAASVGSITHGLVVRPGSLPAANVVARVYPATSTRSWPSSGSSCCSPDRVAAVAPLAPVGHRLGRCDGVHAGGGDGRAGITQRQQLRWLDPGQLLGRDSSLVVAAQTMQPTRSFLWLRPRTGPGVR